MSKRQQSIKEALALKEQLLMKPARLSYLLNIRKSCQVTQTLMLTPSYRPTQARSLSLSQVTLSRNMMSVVMDQNRHTLNYYKLQINQGLGFFQRGSLARKSLSIAVLSPAGLITSPGPTGFTGRVVIIRHTASYVEMFML